MSGIYVWTDERMSVLAEMAYEGRSQRDMAVVFNVSESTIARALKRFALKTKGQRTYAYARRWMSESPANLERWAKMWG